MEKEIINMVKQMAGNNFLSFDQSLTIKKSPHDIPIKLSAVSITAGNDIHLMDSGGQCFPLSRLGSNYALAVSSLFQRISYLYKNYHHA